MIGWMHYEDGAVIKAEIGVAKVGTSGAADTAISEVERTLRIANDPALRIGDDAPGYFDATNEGWGRDAIAWMASDRCLLGMQHPLEGARPFVALLRAKAGRSFPRWKKELARLCLVYEGRGNEYGGSSDAGTGDVIDHALDRLSAGVLILDGSGTVLKANITARRFIERSTTLAVTEGRLVGTKRPLSQQLRDVLSEVVVANSHEPRIARVSEDGDPVGLTVITIARLAPGLPYAFAVISGGAGEDRSMQDLLLAELRLTPAERRLAQPVLDGRTLESAASQASVRPSTARSYLKRIYEKTGVGRQGEFVALVARALPPFRFDPD